MVKTTSLIIMAESTLGFGFGVRAPTEREGVVKGCCLGSYSHAFKLVKVCSCYPVEQYIVYQN